MVLLSLVVAPASTRGGASEATVATFSDATVATFSGTTASQHVDALAGQIGSRPAGSINYDRAVEYVSDQLRQWGYQPSLQSFPVQTYDDRGSRVEIVGRPGEAEIGATTLLYSAAGQVEAPLVAVGLARPEDFSATRPMDARGAIALVKRGQLRFSDKVANAAAAGALAVVVYNDGPGSVQGSLVEPSTIPALTISGDDGQRLLDLLAAGPLTLRVAVDASIEQRTGTNVLAERPAGQPEAGTVLFGAHLDSVPAGPGANDNASGSAVVLELARVLAERDPAQTAWRLRFALFGAEELGLVGSHAYVQSLSDTERGSIVAMINLDMVGVGQAWRFGGTDDLVQRALGVTSDLSERALPLGGAQNGASDHASFLEVGIPAVFIHRLDDPNYHTAGDRPELVDPTALGEAGAIALGVLDGLAPPSR